MIGAFPTPLAGWRVRHWSHRLVRWSGV